MPLLNKWNLFNSRSMKCKIYNDIKIKLEPICGPIEHEVWGGDQKNHPKQQKVKIRI